jgi:hypothetical protein
MPNERQATSFVVAFFFAPTGRHRRRGSPRKGMTLYLICRSHLPVPSSSSLYRHVLVLVMRASCASSASMGACAAGRGLDGARA